MNTSPYSHFRQRITRNVAVLLLLVVAASVADWKTLAQTESASSGRSSDHSPDNRFFDATLNRNVLSPQDWLTEYVVKPPAAQAETFNPIEVIQIPVFFNVITDSNGDGYVSESRLDAQINVLNNAFNGANVGANVQFFFWKANVTRISNHDWFNMLFLSTQESGPEHEAKRRLRQGGANVLNFYTISSNPPPNAIYPQGWAPFPSDYTGNPCRDGVVVPFTTLPGDTNPNNPFNAGDLPVHEVGHWLGLLHTRQGGCSLNNDQVDDTPAHLNESVGQCPSPSTDTCPSLPGTDPIYNYMTDYSDECKSQFTPGQFARMRDQFVAFRQSGISAPSCPVVAISISDVTVTEGNSGNTTATFTITLSSASSRTVSGNVATANGTATNGDYLPVSSTFGFVPGQTTQTISINVIGDTTVEATENFFVNLSSPVNAILADGQGMGTITNDDGSYYEIVARHSGKCLDIAGGSTTTGAMLTQWTCLGLQNQQFRIISVGGGYSKIVARHSGKVLDVQWGSLDNGAPVWQMDENGTPAQQWKIIDIGSGYVRIMARHSGKALDVAGGFTANGTQVHQWDYVGISNQQWRLRVVQ